MLSGKLRVFLFRENENWAKLSGEIISSGGIFCWIAKVDSAIRRGDAHAHARTRNCARRELPQVALHVAAAHCGINRYRHRWMPHDAMHCARMGERRNERERVTLLVASLLAMYIPYLRSRVGNTRCIARAGNA